MQRREYLEAAAAAAALAAGDVTASEHDAQRERLLALADRDDADRWEYSTHRNLASVQSGLLNAELDALCDHPSGTVQTYGVDNHGVPFAFDVETDDGHSVGNLVHLTAEQAEALAVDLLEQAHAAHELRDD